MSSETNPRASEAEPREWDAAAYDRVSDVQENWSRAVIDRLDLRGDETVLDAGCGSGRVTRLLLERLPEGRVIGVDSSRAMIERAQEALPDRTEFIVSDLLDLDLDEAVDAVFSNATFHWILDHRKLFERLYAALRPGGVLEAQCGGIGNLDEFLNSLENVDGDERFAPYLRGIASTLELRLARRHRCAPRGRWVRSGAVLARAANREATRAARVSADRVLRRAPGPATGAPSRAVPGRGARVCPAPSDLGLHAAEHLGPQAGGLVPAAVRVAERAAQLLGHTAGVAERLVS